MKRYWQIWKRRWQEPWMRVILYITAMLCLPEYIAPPLAMAAVVAAYKDAKKQQRSLLGGSFARPLMLYIVYILLTMIYSVDRLSTLSTAALWMAMLSLYIALVTIITDRKRLQTALYGVIGGIGFNGLVAICQYLLKAVFGVSVDMQCWAWIDRGLHTLFGYALYPDFGSRASASFNNPNVLAECFVILLPFAFYFLSNAASRKRSGLSRACTLLAVFGLLFTFSRGAYLALLLIAALFLAINIHKAPLLLTITLSILLLLPNAVYARFFSVAGAKDYVSGVVENIQNNEGGDLLDTLIEDADKPPEGGGKVSKSFSERFEVWGASLDAIRQRPLWGYGTGYFAVNQVLSSYQVAAPHAHNLVLQLLLEGGVLALGLWMAIAFAVVRKGYRLLLHSSAPQSGMMTVAFVCGFCVISMTDYPLLTPKLIGCLMIALGLIETAYALDASDNKIRPLTQCLPWAPLAGRCTGTDQS